MGWIIGKGIGIPFRMGGAGLGSSYWLTRTPTLLTLSNIGYPEGIKLDWTNAGVADYDGTSIERSADGITYAEIDTVASGVLTYQDTTAVFQTEYYYRVRCYKGTNYSPYSNVDSIDYYYTMLLTSSGTGAGVSTLRMTVSSDIVVTLSDNAKFYTDGGGTLNESSTWNLTAGAARTIYLKCTSGTALMTFSDQTKITRWGIAGGQVANSGWQGGSNSPMLTADFTKLTSCTTFRASGNMDFTSDLPPLLNYLQLEWESGGNVAWVNSNPLPDTMTHIYMYVSGTHWSGLSIGDAGNVTTLYLFLYRLDKMSSADMLTLLTQLTNRAGTLPTSITINEYLDAASPPAYITDAVNTLKATKSITTVILGA